MQAVVGIGRIGLAEAAPALLPLTADKDPIVAHVAINALVSLRAVRVCLEALDEGKEAKFVPGAVRVLQSLHEPAVVEGLIARCRASRDARVKQGVLKALARLYNREAEWDGKWWGTRPDTTGPYFKPVAWSESGKIAELLKEVFARADAETLRWLLPELYRNRVDLPDMTARLIKLAGDDDGLRRLAVKLLTGRAGPPAEAVPLLRTVSASTKEDATLRRRPARTDAAGRQPNGGEAVVAALTGEEKLPRELELLWGEFVRDGRRMGNVEYFIKLTEGPSPSRRELAYGVLATIASRTLGSAAVRAQAGKVVDAAWDRPEAVVPLLQAVARLNLTSYGSQVRRLAGNANPQVAAAAKTAVATLRLDRPRKPGEKLIGQLKYEEVAARLGKKKGGDVAAGSQMFIRLGCVNCHTVSPGETLKGPFLGGIASRYSRAELIESILKPSAKIAQGFETQLITLTNGKQVTGFVVREAGTEVELRDATGAQLVIKKTNIEEREKTKVSVMPEGLLDKESMEDLAALLAYLESLKGK